MSKFDLLIIDVESYVYQACTACKTLAPMGKGNEGKFVEIYDTNYRDWETDRKSTRLNSSHSAKSRMPSSA